MSPEIKVNELRKNRKHIARNTIVDKMVAKGKEARGRKQETEDREGGREGAHYRIGFNEPWNKPETCSKKYNCR